MAEEVGEVLRVEFGEPLAVVNGFADDEHGGKRQVVVVDYAGEVFQLSGDIRAL